MCLQHFASVDGVAESDVTNYAGAVKLADYCPYVQVCSYIFFIFNLHVKICVRLFVQSAYAIF